MAQQDWTRLAKRTALLVNAGWWIDLFAPMLIALGLVGAVTLLILRSQFPDTPPQPLLFGGIAALLIATAISYLVARKRFISLETAFVRLEKHLHLHNSLTVALAGISPWPQPPGKQPHIAGLCFRWSRILTPVLLATAALAAAILLPIDPTGTDDPTPNEPLAWAQMDSWIDELTEEDVVEEKSVEEIRAQIEQLRSLDKDEWFSHSSLEATDNLSAQLSNSIRKLGLEADTAQRSLSMLDALDETLSESARDRLTRQYQEAIKGLAAGQLPPNAALLKQLQNLDLSQLANLSPEQLKSLKEQLKNASGACKACLGMTPGKLPSDLQAELDALIAGQGLMPGRGGINRGPGTAPVALSNDPEDLHTNSLEPVATGDYSRATLGDMLGESDGEHDIDTTITSPTRAGDVTSTGKGGTRIWRDSLVPKEKAILKKYFE